MVASTVVLGSSSAAQAASFTVNDPSDYPLATSTATGCVSTHDTCTLRAAVQAADNSGGANTIVLPTGTYKLTIPAAGPSTTADPSTGDLDVTDSLTITGAGSGATVIDANHLDRAFAVQDEDALSLSGLTIKNGSPSANSTGTQRGGAIYSHGAVSLSGDVTLSDNSAPLNPGAQGGGFGGAVFVTGAGSPTFTGVTFTDNTAQFGGAVFLLEPDATTVTDSVFTGNTASTLAAENGQGGGRRDL
jgi:predicted outer membrane repeat protein